MRSHLIITATLPILGVYSQNLSDQFINQVSARLADSAKTSWELGTRAQAILSINASLFSVLSFDAPLPPPTSVPANLTSALQPFFEIARSVVQNLNQQQSSDSPRPLIPDGSAADPASIGFAVLLANWTNQPLLRDGGNGSSGVQVTYEQAAKEQLDYLLYEVPRTKDGAISHRVSQVQLWSDFIYMVPPFFAYYGILTYNRTLLEAYNQIRLYRSHLFSSQSLWKHVLLGDTSSSSNPGSGTEEEEDPKPDPNAWSTGNAWVAAGILRVLSTFRNSPEFRNTLKKEQKDLGRWIEEVFDGIFGKGNPGGVDLDQLEAAAGAGGRMLMGNYADKEVDGEKNFEDASSTAFLVASVYRYSLIAGVRKYVPLAERIRKELSRSSSSSSSNTNHNNNTDMDTSTLVHFTPTTAWLRPVVNPHSYGAKGEESPEGQAFVVEMHAAWRDWVRDGAKGANGMTVYLHK